VQVTLWYLPISHYSEKVRWALHYKGIEYRRRTAIPGPHIAVALALTRGRGYTFPVLELDGERFGDSTEIIAALERRFPEPALYPQGAVDRARALALEDYFDQQLGIYIRRLVFHEMQRDGEQFTRLAASQAPPPLDRFPGLAAAYGRAYTGVRFLVVSERASERARTAVLAALDRLEAELDGGDYLVGGRFTVADLTAAAMFYPLALPAEGPRQLQQSSAFTKMREPLLDRPGIKWVLDIYRRHRRRPAQAEGEPNPAGLNPATTS
jgi:glutathione S-transferase